MIRDAQPALFDLFPGRTVEIRQVDEQVSSDGGLIAFRELDQKLGLTLGLPVKSMMVDPTQIKTC